jgi:hypothetical protein
MRDLQYAGLDPFDGSFDRNADAFLFDGPRHDVYVPNPFEDPPAACTNCHGESTTSTGLFSAVSHTPEQTGGFSEDELTSAFLHGTIPDGGYYDPNILPLDYWTGFHTWHDIDTTTKQRGMNAYLRSLEPKAQTGCLEIFVTDPCCQTPPDPFLCPNGPGH